MHGTGSWKTSGLSDVAAVVAVDAQPVQLALAHDLLLANHGDVVLRLAGR
jgi:hypothetical protein